MRKLQGNRPVSLSRRSALTTHLPLKPKRILGNRLALDVLEYRRCRSVIIQSERFGFVLEDDLARERRLALSQSFGIYPDFDKRELVVGRSSGCHLPTPGTGAEAPIGYEDDAVAAIGQGDAVGVLNRIADNFAGPKISDGRRFTECGRQGSNGITGPCIASTAAAASTTAARLGGNQIRQRRIVRIQPCRGALISARSATASSSATGAPASRSSS